MEDKSYDNSNNERFIKTMVAWRINENSDSEILKKIKSNFNDSDNFLKMDNNLIVGKKIDTLKYTNKDILKPYQIIGDMKNIFPTIKSANKNANDSSTFATKQYSARVTLNKNKSLHNSPLKKDKLENFTKKVSFQKNTSFRLDTYLQSKYNIEQLSDQQIEKMFKEKKEKSMAVSKDKLNNEILKNMDPKCVIEMKEFLIKQEKALENKEAADNKLSNLAKFIVKKTEKKEKELLMNKTDGFRLKNQCIQRIQSSNPLKTCKYGVYNDWRLNLRKDEVRQLEKNNMNDNYIDPLKSRIGSSRIMNNPTIKHLKSKSKNNWGTRTLLNIRNDGDDLGIVVFDDNNHEIEQVIKPNTACLKDFRKYANNRTISSRLRNMNLNSEEMIGINNLNVNGLFLIKLKNILFNNVKKLKSSFLTILIKTKLGDKIIIRLLVIIY